MSKRRIVELLPAELRSEDLKNFFSSTVDHLFQPGKANHVAGYIGRKPFDYDYEREFYIPGRTLEREAHQLEAMMVSSDANGINHALFYDDLVNSLRSAGALIDDESRLFEGDYYSWAPPIDIDKVNNFSSYYWFPEGDVPLLQLHAPFLTFTSNGVQTVFSLPPVIEEYEDFAETPLVLVNGEFASYTRFADQITLSSAATNGATIKIYRYADLWSMVEGATSFDPRPLIDEDYRPSTAQLTSGMRVIFVDGLRPAPDDYADAPTYYVEEKGTGFRIIPYEAPDVLDPIHIVMQRGSVNENPWSVNNRWVHRAAIEWAGEVNSLYQAKRPIIEFDRRLELFLYGDIRLPDVDGIITGVAVISKGWDTGRWDTNLWDIREIGAPIDIVGQPAGTVIVDNDYTLQTGDRLLIAQTLEAGYSQRIVTVGTTADEFGTPMISFDIGPPIAEGSMVYVKDVGEYVFLNGVWIPAQPFVARIPPLFSLYDTDGIPLTDLTVYRSSQFGGSRLFGYAVGTGTADPLLGHALKRDASGEIVFENDLHSRVISYDDGKSVQGYRFYRLRNDDNSLSWKSDWHPAPTPSIQTFDEDTETFSIPTNLQANPDNDQVVFITPGEWFEHFGSIIESQDNITGVSYNTNNYRDTPRQINLGKRILQHRAPLLRSMLMCADEDFDYLRAVRYAESEYSRFRSRFNQKLVEFYINGTFPTATPLELTNEVLNSLRGSRTNDFPFAYSQVGGGQFFIPPTPSAMGLARPFRPRMEIDGSFSESLRVIVGHDGSRHIASGELLTIVHSTGDAQVYLLNDEPYGDVRVTINNVETDDYTQNGRIITLLSSLSHGDTVVVSVDDIRDQCNLALENLIYDNIDSSFRSDVPTPFRLDDYIAGRFYEKTTERANYSLAEFTQVLLPFFLNWAQANQVDYKLNASYDGSDPWTWNYRGTKDYAGETIPVGNWRALYHYFFGTHRPHQTPWEMLGFRDRPAWWVSQYGNAPYVSTNTAMWEDIRDGQIVAGARAGTNPRYARPDLLDILPIDASGTLMSPIEAGIVPQTPDASLIENQWMFGDMGPIEHLWRTSSTYPFAIASVSYILKPARWIEAGWDTRNNRLVYGSEWINRTTRNRPVNAALTVHGETISGTHIVVDGVQQWIAELMISRGQFPSIFGNAVRGLGARLGHKMGGFASSDSLKISAENFGLVPQEDAQLFLYNSPSQREEFYSGVIVEWTGEGWRVVGYDSSYAAFRTIPGDPYGPKETVRLEDDTPVVVPWKAKVFYTAGLTVIYEGSAYECIRPHMSSAAFEQNYWTARPELSLDGTISVQKAVIGLPVVKDVPYGTIFTSRQEVADFIFAYERYLLTRGWVFTATDSNTSNALDWLRMVKDFLDWTQVQWSPGNFIALSPGADRVDFFADNGTIRNVESNSHGVYGIVNRAGMPIPRKDAFVSRLDGELTVTTRDSDLSGLRVSVSEVEHALILSNITIFGDIIYKPILDVRQNRLRMVAQFAPDWRGRLDAPGYIITDGRLAPNFDKSADDIRYAFDIEDVDNVTMRDHARHVVGYESRSYLDSILLSDTQQFEFHQGMMHQKGSPDVFNKLLRSELIGENRVLRFLEEWAFKTGTYGAIDNTLRVSFILDQGKYKKNPQAINFVNTTSTANTIAASDSILLASTDFIEAIGSDNNIFPERTSYATITGDFPDAGFVRLSEVDFTSFNTSSLSDHYDAGISDGTRIWVYENETFNWDVIRAFTLSSNGYPNRVSKVVASSESEVETFNSRVYFENAVGLSNAVIGSHIVINGPTRSDQDFEGLQRVLAFGTDWVEIDADCETGYLWTSDDVEDDVAEDPENAPEALILRSVVFANSTAVSAATGSWLTPKIDELIFYKASGRWISERWNGTAWVIHRQQPYRIDNQSILNSLIYNTGSEIVDRHLYSEPLATDHLLVFDPMVGNVPGEAERELSYKIEYDPASYDDDEIDENWGREQLGKLWWDLSTVRFLNPQTDVITEVASARNTAEIEHRQNTWGRIAPGASVDVYEWTRSLVSPPKMTDKSSLYRGGEIWIETAEFDGKLQKMVPTFYFWSKGNTSVPPTSGRKISADRVARLIQSPATAGVPWLAAISRNCLLVNGVEQYLTANQSVLQIEVNRNAAAGAVHTQWKLLRAEDERSVPDTYLWNRLVDSLVGWNLQYVSVPQANLHPESRQGISTRPRQSLFSSQLVSDRETVLAARESLVGIINLILSRRFYNEDLSPLSFGDTWGTPLRIDEDTTLSYLSWSSESALEVTIPTADEYDYEVTSMSERNKLILTPAVRYASSSVRILVNGLVDDIPYWSVWIFNPNNPDISGLTDNQLLAAIAAAPDVDLEPVFVLSGTHEFEIFEPEEFFDISPTVGSRVLYHTPDEYWQILRYDPDSVRATPTGVTAGYYVIRNQHYKTSDFVDRVDWYADGYSAATPPIISYDTELAMRNAEKADPVNTFVKVMKGSHATSGDRWVWFVFQNDSWIEVAREKGTFAISENIYDTTHAPYRRIILDYALRDGGHELRRVLDAVYNDRTLFSYLELNEIFFSLVNFAHAHCDQVNWAFKTSFLHISGYNELLGQSPTAKADTTESLLSYIDEVKPYRVKTRDFSRSLSPPLLVANVHMTDFDKPVYRDLDTNIFRPLDIDEVTDLTIVEGQRPWSEWYAEREGKVRHITTHIVFDRIDGAVVSNTISGGTDTLSWTTLSRPGHPLANSVLGAARKIDLHYEPSGDMAAKAIRDLMKLNFRGTMVDGETISNTTDHYYGVDGNGVITTSINPDVDGFPSHRIVDPHHSSDRPEELIVAGHHDCVYFNVKSNGVPGAPRQIVRTFERRNLNIVDGNFVVPVHETVQSNSAVAVFCDGLRQPPSSYEIDHFKREIYLADTHPSGELIKRVSFHAFGFGSTSKIIEQRFFPYTTGGTNVFPLSNNGIAEIIVNGTFIVEKLITNKAATISETTLLDGDQIVIVVREESVDEPAASIRVFAQEFEYTGSREFTPTVPTGSVGVTGDVANATIIEVNGLRLVPQTDYTTYSNGSFLLANTVSVSSVSSIVSTTFRNHVPMDINTTVFSGNSNGEYIFDTPIPSANLWVSLNGKRVIQGADFRVSDGQIKFSPGHATSDVVVATTFLGNVAEIANQFIFASVIPGKNIMHPIRLGDYDTTGWDDTAWDDGEGFLTVQVPSPSYYQGQNRRLHHMDGGWEYVRVLESHSSLLATDLSRTANAIVVQKSQSQDAFDINIFGVPQPDAPGVVWINGERIEYGTIIEESDTITLGSIRRGTRGTRIGDEERSIIDVTGNGSTTDFFFANANETAITAALVTIANAVETYTPQYEGVNYSVNVVSNGATISMFSPPANGARLVFIQTKTEHTHVANTMVIGASVRFNPQNTVL